MTDPATREALRAALREELANHIPARLVSVATAARALGISQSSCWQLVASGALRSFKVGRRRVIPTGALDEFVTSLEKEHVS